MKSRGSLPFALPGISFALLSLLFVGLWLAGGSSRADVAGQAVVRLMAWGTLIAALLFEARFAFAGMRAVLVLLIAIAAVPALQLLPMPPAMWRALPGRDAFGDAVLLSGAVDAWRPLSLVPSATANALASLIVPATVVLLVSGLDATGRARLPGLMLAVIGSSMAVALLQFTGARFNQPLINYTGAVSGTFANRNHFALFAAIGCLLAPAWAFGAGRRQRWRLPAAAALMVLLILSVLASGSRAGMAIAVIALVIGPLAVYREIRREITKIPRRWRFVVAGTAAMAVIGLAGLSFAFGRAASIDRLVDLAVGEDMRSRGLPVVLEMTRTYFPVGIGLGGFDPLFRLHEPFALLKPTYFNQAHDDLLGVVLDAGAPGLLMLIAAIGWWLWASLRVWRGHDIGSTVTGRLGSAVILMIVIASIVDYPARTPMMMAVIAVAATWLSRAASRLDKASLPG